MLKLRLNTSFAATLHAIFIAVLILANSAYKLHAQAKNVLVLHSYNSGLSWTDEINKGIFDSFKSEYPDKINLQTEFLDTKHFHDPKYYGNYKDYLQKKYENIDIKLIISVDNAALDLLLSNRDELFTNIPIVFCGINYYDSIPEGFTGIIEDIDIESNLKNILNLHPNYNKLYIINDLSKTGKSVQNTIEKEITSHFSDLRYEYLTDYTLEELQNKLTTLQENDVVLLLLFTIDRLDNVFSYDVLLDYLNPYCHVPMYSAWNFYTGKGIVGGNIASPYPHGVLASLKAKKVLDGTPISTIPIDTAPLQYIFDYKQLKKHSIKRSSLPSRAIIINRPLSFIKENPDFYLMLGFFVVFLLLTILLLIHRFRHARNSLRKEKELIKAIEFKSTELKEALKKANHSNELKKKFIENISHEIRTPLNGIMGFSSLLEGNPDLEKQHKYINFIHTCGNQLTSIIDNILTISMIDSNQAVVRSKTVKINKLLKAIQTTYLEKPENDIVIQLSGTRFHDDSDIIITDEVKLTQILSNLIQNSLKFSHKGKVEIGYNYTDSFITFFVKDQGIGIPKKHQDVIFERFEKINGNKTDLYRGTGLGLAICKAYVELLGGTISIKSEENKGTFISFALPLIRPKQSGSNSLKPGLTTKQNNINLLIIDNDKLNFQYIYDIFQFDSINIYHASTEEEALSFLNNGENIEMVLLDLDLPATNGNEFCQSILDKQPGIKIITHVSPNNTEQLSPVKNVSVLSKPVSTQELINEIDRVLNQ